MSEQKRPVLAQYTIRSKQDYIFETNRVVEIVGASALIRDAWKLLFECAYKLGMRLDNVSKTYDHEAVLKNMKEGNLNLVELFCGGGNETVLFDDYDSYIKLNKCFSKELLEKCPGMIPMSVCVEVTDNYKEDYESLMREAEIEKNKMYPGQKDFILPFSMIDRDTFKPYTRLEKIDGVEKRYSAESYTKRKKGIEERDDAVKILDDIVTKKGEESLLAVVHADGNNMGNKISTMLKDKSAYSDCIGMMRDFTSATADVFVTSGIKAMEQKAEQLKQKGINPKKLAFRVIVKDGDDMTFICNARYVFEYVKAYLDAVQNYESKESEETKVKFDWKYSSCAGICIFHSHYPFSQAYKIAEQACDDGAKKKVHIVSNKEDSRVIEEGWMDFHYIHSGIGGSLDAIREQQNTKDCMARPWLVSGNAATTYSIDKLDELHIVLKKDVVRASIKNIGAAYEEGKEYGLRELARIYNHLDKKQAEIIKTKLSELFGDEEHQLKAIYDYAEVYDLIYKEVK